MLFRSRRSAAHRWRQSWPVFYALTGRHRVITGVLRGGRVVSSVSGPIGADLCSALGRGGAVLCSVPGHDNMTDRATLDAAIRLRWHFTASYRSGCSLRCLSELSPASVLRIQPSAGTRMDMNYDTMSNYVPSRLMATSAHINDFDSNTAIRYD